MSDAITSPTAMLFDLNRRIDDELTNLATAHALFRAEGFTDAELEPIRAAQEKIREIRNSVFGIR